MSIKQINSALLNAEELFRTTQDTIFFILVVDSFIFACRGSRPEVKVAMEIENEHLAEIPHLGVLYVRSKSGEVFCLDAIVLSRNPTSIAASCAKCDRLRSPYKNGQCRFLSGVYGTDAHY